MKPCFSSSEPDIKYEETEDVDAKEASLSTTETDSTKKPETEVVTQNEKDTESSEEPMESSSIEDKSLVEESEKPSTPCVTPSSKAPESKILDVTPKKTMSPRQLQKHLESEKKRRQKQMEREEKERKKQEEKEEKLRLKQELQKQKQEKEEQKKKEKEEKELQKKREREEKELQKKKEKEEKEQKRKEKEEKEEQRRKEKEQERLKKQQEIDEKNREKQRQEEQKQKAAAAFANFFVPLKTETEEKKPVIQSAFMPFEVKSDMKLAPFFRNKLTDAAKEVLTQAITKQDASTQTYLLELKSGHKPRKSEKTWPYVDPSDDVILTEDGATLGESVYEQKPKMEKMRVKFLKFHENRRPPYYGTWRKKSETIRPRRPLLEDKVHFDYEVDSDDDWEEEEQGESITGSDGEDKENESEDYEVDNEFFVPHGHLSDDEVDDEETNRLSPEAHKAKLKLLKNEFDEEMKSKTQKFKPRVIGCIWYTKDGKVDEAIDRFLQPLAIITNKTIVIKKRSDPTFQNGNKKRELPSIMDSKLIPKFLELIHGSTKKKKYLVKEFLAYLQGKEIENLPMKSLIARSLKQLAEWTKCPEEGPMFDKFCWYVNDEVREKHGVKLDLPNKWDFITKEDGVAP